jgi:hypothetical protein
LLEHTDTLVRTNVDERRADKLELSIIETVEKLNTGASAALQASHSILHYHRAVVRTIEGRLTEITNFSRSDNKYAKQLSSITHRQTPSKDSGGGPLFSLKTSSALASYTSSLAFHSTLLTTHVSHLQSHLRTLTSTLELTSRSASRRALLRKIWLWLSRVFKALSVLLGTGGAIVALVYPVGFLESTAVAGVGMVSGAVARLCEVMQESECAFLFILFLAFLVFVQVY